MKECNSSADRDLPSSSLGSLYFSSLKTLYSCRICEGSMTISFVVGIRTWFVKKGWLSASLAVHLKKGSSSKHLKGNDWWKLIADQSWSGWTYLEMRFLASLKKVSCWLSLYLISVEPSRISTNWWGFNTVAILSVALNILVPLRTSASRQPNDHLKIKH